MWSRFFFSSRRRHTRYWRDWSSDVCSSDLRLVGIEGVAALVDVGRAHRLAHPEDAAVGLLLAADHPEQRRLAGAVRPDDPDDPAARQLEREVVDQDAIAVPLPQVVGLDQRIAPARARRYGRRQAVRSL